MCGSGVAIMCSLVVMCQSLYEAVVGRVSKVSVKLNIVASMIAISLCLPMASALSPNKMVVDKIIR